MGVFKALNAAKDSLLSVLNDWTSLGSIPEVEWNGRMKALEFQETIEHREELIQHLPTYTCKECPDFEQHVRIFFPKGSCIVTDYLTIVVHRYPWREDSRSRHCLAEDDDIGPEFGAHTRL